MKIAASKLRYMITVADTAIALITALNNINNKEFENSIIEKIRNKDNSGLEDMIFNLTQMIYKKGE